MENPWFPYGLIYGPHLSKRLGLSLGIDLAPMACTFNCVYCERGKTLLKCKGQKDFKPIVDMDAFLRILRSRLKSVRKVNCLTFSGTGEPTLEPRLGEFITGARRIIGKMPIRVITNSSLLTHLNVRENLARADEVIVKLNAVSNEIFTQIHRPFDVTINTERILEGLDAFREESGNQIKISIEVLLVYSRSIKTNTTAEEIMKLTQALRGLEPNNIQLHTITRKPAEPYCLPAKKQFLEWASVYIKNELPKTQVSTYF